MNEVIFYVSPAGCDENAGTREAPFKSIARAQAEARRTDVPATVEVLAGTYKESLVFDSRDSGDIYFTRENAVLTGSFPLGVSNEFIGVNARVSVDSGSLILIWADKGDFYTRLPKLWA